MKDQYVGDVGDYSKYGLLRFLLSKGYSLGINWYYTIPDSSGDGGHIGYLNSREIQPDPILLEQLKDIIKSNNRNIATIEQSGILPEVVFFNKQVPLLASASQARVTWHNESLKITSSCNIVFLDPDNGIEVKSKRKFYKYATYAEIIDYYKNGNTVIIYQHNPHESNQKYNMRFDRLITEGNLSQDQIMVVRSRKHTQTDFIFLMQPSHSTQLREFVANEFIPRWKYNKKKNEGYCDLFR